MPSEQPVPPPRPWTPENRSAAVTGPLLTLQQQSATPGQDVLACVNSAGLRAWAARQDGVTRQASFLQVGGFATSALPAVTPNDAGSIAFDRTDNVLKMVDLNGNWVALAASTGGGGTGITSLPVGVIVAGSSASDQPGIPTVGTPIAVLPRPGGSLDYDPVSHNLTVTIPADVDTGGGVPPLSPDHIAGVKSDGTLESWAVGANLSLDRSVPSAPTLKAVDQGGGGTPTDLPVGSIILWTGTVSNVPSGQGWWPCDGSTWHDGVGGTGRTADLRDKFVMGAGARHPQGSSGGDETHSHALGGETQLKAVDMISAADHTHQLADTIQVTTKVLDHFKHHHAMPDPGTGGMWTDSTRILTRVHDRHVHSYYTVTSPPGTLPLIGPGNPAVYWDLLSNEQPHPNAVPRIYVDGGWTETSTEGQQGTLHHDPAGNLPIYTQAHLTHVDDTLNHLNTPGTYHDHRIVFNNTSSANTQDTDANAYNGIDGLGNPTNQGHFHTLGPGDGVNGNKYQTARGGGFTPSEKPNPSFNGTPPGHVHLLGGNPNNPGVALAPDKDSAPILPPFTTLLYIQKVSNSAVTP